LLFDERKPFVLHVKPGEYPLILVSARRRSDQAERIAFAILRFADKPIARWELAEVEGESGIKSENCYGVDSGAGGFCDASAQEILLNLADPEGTYIKRLEKEMAKSYQHTRSWVHVQTKSGSAANLLIRVWRWRILLLLWTGY